MSHQRGESSDAFSPHFQFYHGPYGRMFPDLAPHVPTLDLIKGVSVEREGMPKDIYDAIQKILPETGQDARSNELRIIVRGSNVSEVKLDAETILKNVQDAYQRDDSDAGREAILKLLARTMIHKDLAQSEDSSGDNPDIPAGYTYFGQFITHDITFDPTSSLMNFNDPGNLRNFRTPRLDLDGLYGDGPDVSPFMYEYNPKDPNQKYYLLIGKGQNDKEDDLPRNYQGRALIGDLRSDENIIISQLHLAFIKFHNVIMKEQLDQGLIGNHAFREAQRLVRWHYQWVIMYDFLPRFVDDTILADILTFGASLD